MEAGATITTNVTAGGQITSNVTNTGPKITSSIQAGAKGDTGAAGAAGATGPAGANGAPGAGVSPGGTTGQFLRKNGSGDFNTAWATLLTSDVASLDTALAARLQIGGDIGGTATAPILLATANVVSVVSTVHLNQLATPTGNVSMNSHKITSLTNGSASSDAAAFGQIPTSAGSIGGLVAASNLSDVGSAVTAFANLKQAATSSVTGVLQLAGDLGGTATAPLIKRTKRFIVAPFGDSRPCDYRSSGANTDASAVIAAQAAAAALPGGADVELLDGTFVFEQTVLRLPNVHTYGQGVGHTKITTIANAAFNIFDMDKVTYDPSNPLVNSVLAEMEIDGSNLDPASEKKGVNGGNFSRSRLLHLYVHDTTATGIGDDDFYGTQIDECLVVNCGYENKHTIAAASWASNIFTFQTSGAHGYTAWATATDTLTASGTPSDADTVIIDSVVYTFKTALTGAAFEVLINGSAANALTNLQKAIKLTGVAGTDYGTGTTKHPTCTTGTLTSTTLVIQANNIGTAGNAIAVAETSSNLSWGSSTLSGGANGSKIVVTGMIPVLFNGIYNITSIVDSTHFTVSAATNSGGLNFTVDPGTATTFGLTSDSLIGHNGIGIASGALAAELCQVTNCICIGNQNNNFLIEADNNNSGHEAYYAFNNCISINAGSTGFRNTGSINAHFNNCFDYGSLIGGTAASVQSSRTITGVSWSGGVATFTTSVAYLFAVGARISITNMVPDGYNGYFTVDSTPDSTHFTVAIASNSGSGVHFGSVSYSVHPVDGSAFNDCVFTDNLNYGLLLPDDGVMATNPIIKNCWNYGASLSSASNCRISEARIYNNGRQGILIVMGGNTFQPMDNTRISGSIYNNGQRFANCDGIDVDPSITSAAIQNLTIDVHSYDNQETKTQRYGVILRSGGTLSNIVVKGNLSGNATAPILVQNTSNSIYVSDVVGVNPPGEVNLGSTGGSVTFDPANGNFFVATLTSNLSPVMPTPPVPGTMMVWALIQDATGGRTITLPGNANAGATLALSTAASAVDLLTWRYDGASGKWRLVSKNLSGGGVGTLSNLIITTPSGGNVVSLAVTQNDTTNNPDAVDVTNAGTSNGYKITQSGVLAANKYGLFIDSSVAQVNSALARIRQNNASSTTAALQLDNAGSGVALLVNTGGMQVTAGNVILSGAVNLALSTVTGTQIATATNQKLAFYGSTGIVQPTGDIMTALTNLGLIASPVVNTPVNATDIASKGYVDSVAQGLAVKPSAIVATTTTLPTYTYLSGVITMVSTGVVAVDGRNLALNDVVLVKDETSTNAPFNGLYTVTTAGAIGVACILTRHTSMDATGEFQGAFVFVESGTVNASAGFVCTNSAPVTVGVTNIAFQQFSGAGEISAGTGLSKSGNTISLATPVSVANGGTGAATLTGLVVGNGTSAFTVVAAPTGTVVGTTDTQTLTNKRVTPRINTTASSATPSINTDTTDQFDITALAAAITSMTTNLTGTPTDGQKLVIRIKDNGTARAITWGASFSASGSASLLGTTVISKTHLGIFVYDSTAAVWVCHYFDLVGY